MLQEHHFRAMNTDVGVWLWSAAPGAADILRHVEQMFAHVARHLSRFRDDSELSRLNRQAGRGDYPVSPLLQEALAQALAAARQTDGIFDPTVLPQLRQAGYDRSFELLAAPSGESRPPSAPSLPGGWRQIRLDEARGTVRLPAGVAVDLGGIGKGWAVDQAGALLESWGPALVDAGGDIRASGLPDGEPWLVAVEDPFHPTEDLCTLELEAGGIATSTIGKRRWQRNGAFFHHLIDPRTGAPSCSDLHTVTAIGPSAAAAEIAAKTALLLGSAEGAAWLRRQGRSALLIRRDGHCIDIGPLPILKRDE